MTSLICFVAFAFSTNPAEETRGLVRGFLEKEGVAGISVAVYQGGREVFAEGFGWEDRERGRRASADTVYRLASISKVVTATAIMKLVEEGRLDLDADIRSYVPEWPEKRYPVTLRQILTHSSGIRHYTGGNEGAIYDFYTTEEAVKLFRDSDLLFEPGTKQSYSTHAFTVAARAVESAGKVELGEYVQKAVLSPAGVKGFGVERPGEAVTGRSEIYRRVDGGTVAYDRRQDNSWKYGGGGFEASARDLVKWADAVMAGRILKPETVEAMWTPQTLKDGTASYALGWTVAQGGRRVGHSGSQQGSRTNLFIDRETKTVVAVLCNTSGAPINAIDSQIFQLWVEAASGAGLAVLVHP